MSATDFMGDYFDALQTGSFTQFYDDDVTWTIMVDGVCTQGPQAVQDVINTLHARLQDLQTSRIHVGEEYAYIEGSATVPGKSDRIAYCVAYDVRGDRITAMRAYGPLSDDEPGR